MLAQTRSVFAAPFSNVFTTPQTKSYFYKSRVFVSPDASALPPPDEILSFATSVFNSKTSYIHRETAIPSLVHEGIQLIGDHCVPQCGHGQIMTSEPRTWQRSWLPFGLYPFSTSSKQCSAQSSFTPPTFTRTAIVDGNQHGDNCLHAPPTTRRPNVNAVSRSLRSTSEKPAAASNAMAMASQMTFKRMKATASWAAEWIYTWILDANRHIDIERYASVLKRVCIILLTITSTYDINVHDRAAQRILEVLKATLLSPPTVFLALWYINRFPFVVSAADDDRPLDVFYHILCGHEYIAAEDTIFRVFIAGLMLANKNNEDSPLSARDWYALCCYIQLLVIECLLSF